MQSRNPAATQKRSGGADKMSAPPEKIKENGWN